MIVQVRKHQCELVTDNHCIGVSENYVNWQIEPQTLKRQEMEYVNAVIRQIVTIS